MTRRAMKHLAFAALIALLVLGVWKFYHYNYIENKPGQARSFRLPGLRAFVCRDAEYKAGRVDQCGRRSIFKDADWGITAYYTIYGVEERSEGEAIVGFMKQERMITGQQSVPVDVEIYSTPRSDGSRPGKSQILHATF